MSDNDMSKMPQSQTTANGGEKTVRMMENFGN
jgi:hypothetical protein